jgi:Arc/MetJ-type ribon-helix-helix transcriptional regulator
VYVVGGRTLDTSPIGRLASRGVICDFESMNSEPEGYTRITVSLPAQVAAGIRAAVDAGEARNVSALVSQLAEDHLARVQAGRRIAALIGPDGLPAHAHEWARQALGLPAGDAGRPDPHGRIAS